MIERWPRDIWLDAMWDCETLKPAERQVAYVYARYAGDQRTTWVTDEELKKRTGISSRDTISKTRAKLVEKGWLVEVEKHRQHKSGRYQMAIPETGEEMRRP